MHCLEKKTMFSHLYHLLYKSNKLKLGSPKVVVGGHNKSDKGKQQFYLCINKHVSTIIQFTDLDLQQQHHADF